MFDCKALHRDEFSLRLSPGTVLFMGQINEP